MFFSVINPTTNFGLRSSSWSSNDYTGNKDSIVHTKPNESTTLANLLPLTFTAKPNYAYQIQGYIRPYFRDDFIFHLDYNCKSCELLVEQANRSVKTCSGTTDW